MYCRVCLELSGAVVSRGSGPSVVPAPRVSWTEVDSPVCLGCGNALTEGSASDLLLDRLSQLARFGLAAYGLPVLTGRS